MGTDRPDMASSTTESVAHDLQLDVDESLVLTLCQLAMIGRDLVAERNPQRENVKIRYRNEFAASATTTYWARADELPEWAREHARAIADKVPAHQRSHVEAALPPFGARMVRRSRALLVVIELAAYQPWGEEAGWVARARRDALASICTYLPGLGPGDLDAVLAEFAAVSRALAKRDIRWGRLAAASAAGLVLGVATMGIAAPFIATAVGGALGLSGAAATSAGLAFLGGGSVAAGGFGMAGGTALLTGVGALGGAGAAAAGSRLSGWTAGQVVIDAIKLDVIARLVILDAEGDDEKARRVVEGLQARLDEVSATIRRLSEQIIALRFENERLTAENEELSARWEAERADATMAGTALQIVIDRIGRHG
jgi:hypothetical protein